MDEFTARHFENWLQEHVRDDHRDAARKLMLAEYATDPEYYNYRGWASLYDWIFDRLPV